jgi:hypothetical protein
VPQEGRSVYIDDVQLQQSPCSLIPPSASPDYCHPTGPLNCSFQDNTFCGWNSESWNFVHVDSNTAIQLTTNTKTSKKLQSQTSCATQKACLSFRYDFKVNNAINLSVAVKEKSASPRILWSANKSESQHGQNKWDFATIPFSTSDDYVISRLERLNACLPQKARSI